MFTAPKLEQHAEQLSALGHPVRLKVLRFVVKAGPEGAAAGDIQNHIDLTASTLAALRADASVLRVMDPRAQSAMASWMRSRPAGMRCRPARVRLNAW